MVIRTANLVLVDKMAEHDDLFFADLPDDDTPRRVDEDCSDWYFDRLDKEASIY